MTGLQVRNLIKHFGGVKAVNGVSFDVQPGQCVALIGPNGAGKSTTFACVAGQQTQDAGDVVWAGKSLNNQAAAKRLALGVARTFQVAQTFEALTVLHNVQLTMAISRGQSGWKALDLQFLEASRALLAQVGLKDMAHADALTLPYGAKKRLELAMALGGLSDTKASPQLLLLDEPAAGLAPQERGDLMVLIQSLARQGMAVLYTEHNMDAVFGVAEHVLVLVDGLLAAQGSPAEVAQNPIVRSRYLGQSFSHSGKATHA
jgi:branched-chain amino acid transport system ATP-binding protein